MTRRDCESKRADRGGPNVRGSVMQILKNKTPRNIVEGDGGRNE